MTMPTVMQYNNTIYSATKVQYVLRLHLPNIWRMHTPFLTPGLSSKELKALHSVARYKVS